MMDKFKGCFWTNYYELVDDFKEAGYEVVESTSTFNVLENEQGDQVYIELVTAGKTIAVAKMVHYPNNEEDDYDDEL